MLQAEQRWSNRDQLQAEQQGSIRLATGGAVEVECSTAGRAVEVNCGATVRQQGISFSCERYIAAEVGWQCGASVRW